MEVVYKNKKYYILQKSLVEVDVAFVKEQISIITNSIDDLEKSDKIAFNDVIIDLRKSLKDYNILLQRVSKKTLTDKIKNILNI